MFVSFLKGFKGKNFLIIDGTFIAFISQNTRKRIFRLVKLNQVSKYLLFKKKFSDSTSWLWWWEALTCRKPAAKPNRFCSPRISTSPSLVSSNRLCMYFQVYCPRSSRLLASVSVKLVIFVVNLSGATRKATVIDAAFCRIHSHSPWFVLFLGQVQDFFSSRNWQYSLIPSNCIAYTWWIFINPLPPSCLAIFIEPFSAFFKMMFPIYFQFLIYYIFIYIYCPSLF